MLTAERSFIAPRHFLRVICMGAVAASFASGAMAQAVLYGGPGGQVSTLDVQADAATRISDLARPTILSRPANVEQLASNLYVQRMMAGLARAKGLTSSAEAKAQLQIAQEKAMTDLYWADFDQSHQPSDEALDAYAQSTYRTLDDKALQAPARARVRHILLKAAAPNARERLNELLAKAKAGADFAQLARDNSEDQGSVGRGGDVGFVAESDVDPSFARAMATLKTPGDLSDVVETPYGYHLIRLEERREAGKRPFDEMRDGLRMQARAALLKEARAKEVQRLLVGGHANESAISTFSSQFKPVEPR